MSFEKLKAPEELVGRLLEVAEIAKQSGRVKKGVNETTKSIERRTAKLVIVAEDVSPEEIIMHIPKLCSEKGINYVFVPSKQDLGNAVGIKVPTTSIAIEDPGKANELFTDIIKKLPKQESSKKAEEKEEKKDKKDE